MCRKHAIIINNRYDDKQNHLTELRKASFFLLQVN